MFSVPEEIKVTPRMLKAAHKELPILSAATFRRIYRAMEKARRDAQTGIVWGEPDGR